MVVTGSRNEDGGAKAEIYDSISDKWNSLPDLPQIRWLHSSVSVKQVVYLFGGF